MAPELKTLVFFEDLDLRRFDAELRGGDRVYFRVWLDEGEYDGRLFRFDAFDQAMTAAKDGDRGELDGSEHLEGDDQEIIFRAACGDYYVFVPSELDQVLALLRQLHAKQTAPDAVVI